MLVGLVTKNGISIVEFANQHREAGAPTTLATILGILPTALALGAGAESRVSMGIAVIGGLVCSGALTPYVIPAMYRLLKSKRVKVAVPRSA